MIARAKSRKARKAAPRSLKGLLAIHDPRAVRAVEMRDGARGRDVTAEVAVRETIQGGELHSVFVRLSFGFLPFDQSHVVRVKFRVTWPVRWSAGHAGRPPIQGDSIEAHVGKRRKAQLDLTPTEVRALYFALGEAIKQAEMIRHDLPNSVHRVEDIAPDGSRTPQE